jgi:hypothetical protein
MIKLMSHRFHRPVLPALSLPKGARQSEVEGLTRFLTGRNTGDICEPRGVHSHKPNVVYGIQNTKYERRIRPRGQRIKNRR